MDTKRALDIHCSIIADDSQLTDFLPIWEALWERSGHPVFGAPAWTEAWWNVFGRTTGAQLAIVAVRRGKELIGVFPWCIVRRRKLFRVLEWCTWEVADHCGPLLERNADRDAVLGAARAAIWRAGGFDVAALYQVPNSDPFAHWASRHMCKLPVVAEVYELNGQNVDSASFSLDQHNRKAYCKSARAIAVKAGGAVLQTLFTGDDAQKMLSRLLDMKKRWIDKRHEEEEGKRASRRAFFEHVVPALMRAGCANIAALVDSEGAPLAGGVVLEQGSTLMFYFTVSDNRPDVPSPGTVFYIDLISWALGRGYNRVDFLRGRYEYKRKLSNGTYQLIGFVRGRTLLGLLGARLLSWRIKRADEALVIED